MGIFSSTCNVFYYTWSARTKQLSLPSTSCVPLSWSSPAILQSLFLKCSVVLLNYQIANFGLGYGEKTQSYLVSRRLVARLWDLELWLSFFVFPISWKGCWDKYRSRSYIKKRKVFYFSQWLPISSSFLATLPEEKYAASNIWPYSA